MELDDDESDQIAEMRLRMQYEGVNNRLENSN